VEGHTAPKEGAELLLSKGRLSEHHAINYKLGRNSENQSSFTKKAVAAVLGVAVVAMISRIALGGCGAAVEAQQGTDSPERPPHWSTSSTLPVPAPSPTLPDKATIQVSVQDDAIHSGPGSRRQLQDMQKVLARLRPRVSRTRTSRRQA